MTAMPTTAYHPKCDTCGAVYDDAELGELIFTDELTALEYAADMGWQRHQDQLTCPNCLRCARCGEWPAWVGGDMYASHGQILCETCPPGPARIPGDTCSCGRHDGWHRAGCELLLERGAEMGS